MFCQNCGKEMDNYATFCASCGAAKPEQQNSYEQAAAQPNPNAYEAQPSQNPYESQPNPNAYETQPNSNPYANQPPPYNPYQPYNPYNPYNQNPYKPVDHGNTGWTVLGFFIPLVGLILYLTWKDDKPVSSKQAGKGALIGVIVNVAFWIVYVIIMVAVVANL